MTVSEMVYEKALKEGYSPVLSEGVISSLQFAVDTYQKAYDTLREPMETASSIAERMMPQLEAISKMQIPTPLTMPSSFYNEKNEVFIPALTRSVQEVRIVNPEDITFASAKRTNEYVIASYLLPQNATWESLDIHFIDGHFVRISYPGMESKKFDFKDMGFINTKTNSPDLKWKLLKEMADNSGTLTNGKWDRRFSRNVKYELNERLQKFFGMKENPIPHYTKKNGYQARFMLRGDK
ncbi:MAG: hypothetical protein WAV50_03605 [Minisyncoccia bacterium]